MSKSDMTKEEYTEMMKYEFGMYDKDKSGTIEKKEIYKFLGDHNRAIADFTGKRSI